MATKEEATEIKTRNSAFLLGLPGVVGVGVAQDEFGSYGLIVHVETDDEGLRRRMPDQIEGCLVKIVQSGKYRRL